ncbi:MAG: division/cell wall cluster transcriptional repressor MraZ [Bacteroidota bacterium]|jgi:MraZ protein
MLNLLGEYHCKTDAKGRVLFPARLKKQLENILHYGLVVNRDIFTNCLVVYPKPEWDKVNDEMSKLSRYNKKHQLFQRKFMKGATLLELDSVGRLSVPSMLLEYIDISAKQNELVITGLGEKMEIWNATTYQSEVLGEELDFGDLAEEVRKDLERGV